MLSAWYKYSNECARKRHYPLFGQSEFCLTFVLVKNKRSQSEALLQILPLPPSVKGFSLGIQKKISTW